MRVRLITTRYMGFFYKKDRIGRWRKFATIGNAGVACDMAVILQKLGHVIEYIDREVEEESS